MTELETLTRAQMYIEKMANGINPLDGTAVKDDDLLNNIRISRCLFFVSDTLKKVIENGEIKAYYGGHRFGSYLGEDITGELRCVSLEKGSLTEEEIAVVEGK